MSQYVSEEDTPDSYDVSYDDERCPQRDLTEFVVMQGDERISICELDDFNSSEVPIVARGRVVNRGNSLMVETAQLIEWCIEYGGSPNLWIRSASVWYRLQKPARDYVKTHELARRRFELCSRIFILCTTENAQSSFDTIAGLLAGRYGEMQGYSERDIILERDFILAQFRNLGDNVLLNVPFVRELKDKKSGSRKPSSSHSKKNVSSTLSSSGANVNSSGQWVPRGDLDSSSQARLMKKAEKTLFQTMKHKHAFPFLMPVNPVAHGCPDYLERIKQPMDYGTIKKNIENGVYKSALDIVKDVRLVASNCRLYNGNKHDFAIWATEFEKKFENAMRNAEDTERANYEKRANGSSKKRRAGEALGSKSGAGPKTGSKGSRKLSSTTPASASPRVGTLATSDAAAGSGFEAETSQTKCARTEPEPCAKAATSNSKYCSDECGMMVARKRIEEMRKSGFDVEGFLYTNATKSFVLNRS